MIAANAPGPAAQGGRPAFVESAGDNAWDILIRALPGAKKTEAAGIQEGRLRVRLRAQAVENKANTALVTYVARTLGLRASKVSLEAGGMGRQKRLRVTAEKEPDWSVFGPFSQD